MTCKIFPTTWLIKLFQHRDLWLVKYFLQLKVTCKIVPATQLLVKYFQHSDLLYISITQLLVKYFQHSDLLNITITVTCNIFPTKVTCKIFPTQWLVNYYQRRDSKHSHFLYLLFRWRQTWHGRICWCTVHVCPWVSLAISFKNAPNDFRSVLVTYFRLEGYHVIYYQKNSLATMDWFAPVNVATKAKRKTVCVSCFILIKIRVGRSDLTYIFKNNFIILMKYSCPK